MTAELLKVADDAVTLISGETFSLAIESVQRVYVPRWTKETLAELRVDVMPVKETAVRAARQVFSYVYDLQIGISQRVDSIEPADVDPLVNFTQEVADFLRNKRFPTTKVVENGIEMIPYDSRKLELENVYMALITVSLEGLRDV